MTMADGEPINSADQDAWVALFTAARAELAKLVPLIPAMKPDEAKILVEAMQAAMWGHHNAETFDKRTELELSRITAD